MFERFRSRMGEKFADIWVLLSDTDRFVSRARLMIKYERLLREWRSGIQQARGDLEGIIAIKSRYVNVAGAIHSHETRRIECIA